MSKTEQPSVFLSPDDMEKEISAAVDCIKTVTADLEEKGEDAMFTHALAWSIILTLYIDEMKQDRDAHDLFAVLARETYNRVRAELDHGEDEQKHSQGQ